jgi:hypothetical protein
MSSAAANHAFQNHGTHERDLGARQASWTAVASEARHRVRTDGGFRWFAVGSRAKAASPLRSAAAIPGTVRLRGAPVNRGVANGRGNANGAASRRRRAI